MHGLAKLDKDFMQKEAYLSVKDNPAREVLSYFEIETPHNADAAGGEPTDIAKDHLRLFL